VPLADLFRVAFAAIAANKLRSLLTTLGIVIGIGAVITMVALGEGAQRSIEQRLGGLGANVLTVRSGQAFFGGLSRGQARLTVDDAEAIAASPALAGVPIAPEMEGRLQVERQAANANLSVVGSWPDYFAINNHQVTSGRLFNAREELGRRRVVVLGALVGKTLGAPSSEALVGQSILIRGLPFEVVGALAEKGSSGFSNPDESLYVPLSTAQFRLFGEERVRSISVQAPSSDQMLAVTFEIDRILRREHRIRPGQDADFNVRDQSSLLATIQETSRTMSFLLAGIAAISLLVGGIGIMNIMLVSVTERTREIGLRMALGARRGDILRQFLIEAMALCLFGGALGLALGWGASFALQRFAGWNLAVAPESALLAIAFSAGVGLFFGLWPARRAAAFEPIDALRFE
jgi:putative ABC transport system permease protein